MEWNQRRIERERSKAKEKYLVMEVPCFLFSRRELEKHLRELKRRKKEKKMAKMKELEEVREKEKKRWTDFNSKVRRKVFLFNIILHFSSVNKSNMERRCVQIDG